MNPSGWPLLRDSVAAPIEAGFVDFHAPSHQPRPFRSRPAVLTRLAVHHLLYGARGWLWLQSQLADAMCRSVLDPLPGSQRRRAPAWLPQAADSGAWPLF